MTMRVDAVTGVMLRPNETDAYVVRRAAELALPDVKRWLNQVGDHSPEAKIVGDLIKVGMRAYLSELAKRLEEKCGYDPDPERVEILDGSYMREAVEEMTKKWAACVGPEMKLPEGAKVMCRKGAPEGVGEVVRVYRETCEYGVRFPDQAHTSSYRVQAEHVSLATSDQIAEFAEVTA